MAKSSVRVTTPHAAVIVWNYRDRVGPDGVKYGLNTIEQTIISTLSLISVNTSKNKSNPAGNFEIVLAPTKNWVATLTPGSWLCVLMGQDKITKEDLTKADPNKVKLLGRIDSVRVNVSVNQETGARTSTYSVVGSDWAQIFNTTLYVDPAAREPDASAIGTASRWIYGNYLDDLNKKQGLPSSKRNIKALVNMWGRTNATFQSVNEDLGPAGVLGKPEVAFAFPKEVCDYFRFRTESGVRAQKIVDLLHYKTGALTSYDTYNEYPESVGIIRPDTLFGVHTFWQVLTDNCNHILNELVSDIRWDSGTPKLTLYKRIRPFAIRDYNKISTPGKNDNTKPNSKVLKALVSKFENIRRTKIPLENVISFNAGTNWRDKYNYAEIQVDQSLQEDVRSIEVKLQSAVYHSEVFSREGFRPMIAPTKYLAYDKSAGYDPRGTAQWKYMLKEWYFDIHTMLNGTLTFIGIPEYIQVGDNIIIDASVMGPTNNTNSDNINKKGKAFLLAHVESISHNFRVEPESGARSFITTIQFVRGLITDENGKQFTDGRLDIDAAKINPKNEKNSDNVFGTSTGNDPDRQKQDGT